MTTDPTDSPILSAAQRAQRAQRAQFIQDGYARMGVCPDDPDTWAGRAMSTDPDAIAFTETCRTSRVEAAASELVGPDFIPGVTYSPFLDSQGVSPATLRGFIPVLSFPGPARPFLSRPRTVIT